MMGTQIRISRDQCGFGRRTFVGGLATAILVGKFGLSRETMAQNAPAIEIVSPANGDLVTSNDLDITVKVTNFTLDCANVGRPDEEGAGHIHVMLDGMTMAVLTNFYCSDTFTVSLAGLATGTHTIYVGLATNTHMDLMETIQQVEVDYQPNEPVALPDAMMDGVPGVELVSPVDGDTVPPVFTVEVIPVNFTPSEELEGKANIPGYGHYHVFVDTAMDGMSMMMDSASPEADMHDMAMMSMAGMVLMPGTNSFDLDLTAWGPGNHTIWVEPVQNDHTMFEEFGHVEFTVNVDENAD